MRYKKMIKVMMVVACLAFSGILAGCGEETAVTEGNGIEVIVDIDKTDDTNAEEGEEKIGVASLIVPETQEELDRFINQ